MNKRRRYQAKTRRRERAILRTVIAGIIASMERDIYESAGVRFFKVIYGPGKLSYLTIDWSKYSTRP